MKEQIYKKNEVPGLDTEFAAASAFGKVRMGTDYIFWKKGFRWYFLDLKNVQRAFRRVEAVDAKMCCGNVNFDIQKLVFILKDGTELELMIGDAMPREAEKLYQTLQKQKPGLLYGKP